MSASTGGSNRAGSGEGTAVGLLLCSFQMAMTAVPEDGGGSEATTGLSLRLDIPPAAFRFWTARTSLLVNPSHFHFSGQACELIRAGKSQPPSLLHYRSV